MRGRQATGDRHTVSAAFVPADAQRHGRWMRYLAQGACGGPTPKQVYSTRTQAHRGVWKRFGCTIEHGGSRRGEQPYLHPQMRVSTQSLDHGA